MKKIVLITISVMLMLAGQALAYTATGLVAYYPLNGNANDASGNAHNGVVSGAASSANRLGQAANAYSFRGIRATPDYIQIPDSASFNFAWQAFTISAWIRIDGAFEGDAAYGAIFDRIGPSGGYRLDYSTSQGKFRLLGNRTSMEAPATLSYGGWYHVAAISDGGSSKIYLNGSLLATGGHWVDTDHAAAPRIGSLVNDSASSAPFKGVIDDLFVYNRVLSAAEIVLHYNSYTVTASATNGTATPASQAISYAMPATVTGTANRGSYISGVSGCGGTPLTNSNQDRTSFNYTTGAITANCTVTATYGTCTATSCGAGGFSQAISYGMPKVLEASYAFLNNNTISYGPSVMRVELAKSLPSWRYPLRYLHTVDEGPFEDLVKVPNPRPGVSACVDSAAAAAPTCGWQLDGAGQRIADSQGFCTNRSLLDLKNEADPTALLRGEELTGRSTVADPFAIAHCLRLSGVSYRGYEIDNPVRDYKVDVRVLDGTVVKSSFELTPAGPLYQNNTADHVIRAELVGEKAPPPENLSGYILYIPSAPATDLKVLSWQDNMLLVPRRLVSLDSGECDKVGTGYRAFRGERTFADATKAGACLGNQLRQLLAADQARLLANPAAETEYLVKNKRLFRGSQVERSTPLLRLPSPELAYTTVDLEVVPAITMTTENEGMAWIKAASADDFASFSRQGELKAVIENVGVVDASYQVTVHTCTAGIEPVPPQAVRMPFKTSTTLFFPLRSGVAGDHTCYVTLKSATAKIFDEVTVSFTTTAADASPPGGYLPNNYSGVKP